MKNLQLQIESVLPLLRERIPKNKMKKTRQVSTTKRKDEKRKDPRSWNHEKKCVEEVGNVKRKVRVVRIESETVVVFFSAWWDVEKGGMMRKA